MLKKPMMQITHTEDCAPFFINPCLSVLGSILFLSFILYQAGFFIGIFVLVKGFPVNCHSAKLTSTEIKWRGVGKKEDAVKTKAREGHLPLIIKCLFKSLAHRTKHPKERL